MKGIVWMFAWVLGAQAACPISTTGYQAYSTSGLPTGATSDVSITGDILLDQDLDVGFIDISGTGKLMLKPGINITLKTKGIMIRNNASFIIGMEDCKHEDDVTIILKGERDLQVPQTNEGQKYIAVVDNGNLHIHGTEKRHWTELTQTVNWYNIDPSKVKFDHQTSDYAGISTSSQGLTMYIIDGDTMTPKYYGVYDLNKNGDKMEDIIEGDVVVIAIQRYLETTDGANIDILFDEIETVAGMTDGTLKLRQAQKFDAFSMIFVKDESIVVQSLEHPISKKDTTAETSLDHGGYKVTSSSYINSEKNGMCRTSMRILPYELGFPTITVLDDISSWNIGDEVLLTSTDYTAIHAEIRRIKSKPSSTSIQLDGELMYRHFGAVEERVDMRGEVALLTSNIKIKGEMSLDCPKENENCDHVPYDSFGGHIKDNFNYVMIEGAELQFMGQASKLGFYPIHFHMCSDVTHKTSIIRRNTIRDTFARAVTIHGTYGTDEENLGVSGGFNFDNILLNEFGEVTGCMNYRSVVDPVNKLSAPVKVQITSLTAYKNENINVWLRGGYFEMMQYSAAESKRGVQLARGSLQQQFVRKSVIIGRSQGNYEDALNLDGLVIPHYLGIVFYDGPVFISKTSFFGSNNSIDRSYVGGALGFKPKNIAVSSAASTVSDLRFGFADKSGGNRIYDGDNDDEDLGFCNFDGDRTATFRDADGSVTKCPGDVNWHGPVQVIKPEKFLLTERCKYRTNPNMVMCDDLYGKVRVEIKEVFEGVNHDFSDSGQMRSRLFLDSADMQYESHTGQVLSEYRMILQNDPREFYYEFQFSETDAFPKKLHFVGKGVERGLGAVVGICLPEGATAENTKMAYFFTDYVLYKDADFRSVDSIEEVSNSKYMDKVYRNGRMLYMKFDTWLPCLEGWDLHDTDHCPQGRCPTFELQFDEELSYTPCFTPTASDLDTNVDIDGLGLPKIDCDMPASVPPYEANWGAGPTDQSHDGGWGDWSSWRHVVQG